MDAFDALIVGGGPAGLSTALTLGRACRRVLVIDDGRPRNAPAAHAWGYLTRDGTPPLEIRALGCKELARYAVEVRDGSVCGAERVDGGFRLALEDGEAVEGRMLVLATGVQEMLPDKPGLREAWGTSVAHCPYCHGWEMKGRPTAFYGRGDDAFSMGQFLPLWTDRLVVLSDGPAELTARQRAELDARGVEVDEREVGRFEQTDGQLEAVVFADGARRELGALYLKPDVRPKSQLAERLGATLTPNRIIETDDAGRVPGVPGLYVVGDTTNTTHALALAAASGTAAAFALNHDLVVLDTPPVEDVGPPGR